MLDRRIPCDLREHHHSRPGGSSPTQPGQMKPIRALYESGKAETIETLSRKLGGGRGRSAWRLHHTRPATVNMTDVRDLCVYVGAFFFSFPPPSSFDSPESNKKKTLGALGRIQKLCRNSWIAFNARRPRAEGREAGPKLTLAAY